MSEPYIGEIRVVGFNWAPDGWALCNGQLLQINQNQALFAILGCTYGGDGKTNFALPNLQARVPIGIGQTPDMTVTLGQALGEENHQLIEAEMPIHTHLVSASTDAATTPSPKDAVWTTQSYTGYASNQDTAMAPAAITAAGGGEAHSNLQPYQVVNYIIALRGIFPTRD